MSEEWRRGWHPERIEPKGSNARVLVVGAGPAGLEAAQSLGKRGYHVMLAEASRELGGRVTRESRLPGLNEWARVRDYRLQQIEKMDNIEVFRESRLSADDVLDVGADHIVTATGAKWRCDGFGTNNPAGITALSAADRLYTPDDIMADRTPDGATMIFDDDHYYMGTVLAERIRATGAPVTLVTPADTISAWGSYTMDRWRAQTKLMEMGVDLVVSHNLLSFDGEAATLECEYTGRERTIEAEALVLVTARKPNDAVYRALRARFETEATDRPRSLKRIGDCEAPAIIADAVFAGHRYARELDATVDRDNPLKHDRVFFEGA